MITERTIKSVPTKDIILPKDYNPPPDRLLEIEDSILRQGVMHFPIIKDNMQIVAGRLRVKAAQNIRLPTIKCNVIPSDLAEDEYIEISLHENLKRDNMPWNEIVMMEKELHELRLRQNSVAETKRGRKAAWGLRDTAEELHIALGTLHEDLKLAEAIILDPSLRRIQDKATARRVINENIQRSRQEMGASRPVNVEVNKCYLGDSSVVLKMFEDNFFDACITDPPWLEFKDPSLTRDEFTLPVFKELFRVLKQNSFLYAFVSTQDWHFYFEELTKIGFSIQKWPLFWAKEGSLSYGRRNWEYQRDYEPIILAVKGNPSLTDGFLSSVISAKVVPTNLQIHSNEKPIEVIKRLIDHCTYEQAIVVDPFAGSGSVLNSCKLTNRRFIGIEREPKYFIKIEERLKKS